MLFKLEGTNVFLAGSLHSGRPDFYPLPEPIEDAFNAAREVWFEATPPSPDQCMSKCASGRTIRDYLSLRIFLLLCYKEWNRFDSIKNLKPWALANQFETRAYSMEGCSAEFGVEPHIAKKVREGGKTVRYLEEPQDGQIPFDSAPQHEQEKRLHRCLTNFEAIQQEVRDCIAAFTGADLNGWHKLTENTIRDFPYFKKVLYERNEKWSPKIKSIVDSKVSAFVCVGSAHFGGLQSLQFFLKRDFGIEARQIQLRT